MALVKAVIKIKLMAVELQLFLSLPASSTIFIYYIGSIAFFLELIINSP